MNTDGINNNNMKYIKTFEQLINEASDHRPESIKNREKIDSLKTKSDDLLSKAREFENNGEELKAKIAKLSSNSVKLKTRAAEIDWQIKQLKERL
jgi:chromosome segregation ATPase